MITMILDNNLRNISVYDKVGVDRIFLDLEVLGKKERQGHLDTVISDHKISDIKKISKILTKSKLLVRVNPINDKSKEEIDICIKDGADIIMLPMFKTKDEVALFISLINKRTRVCLLLETSEALCRIDSILELEGIDEIHIGLNDLHLSMNLSFMFELLSGGIVEYLSKKILSKNISFGFGGIATLESGLITGEMILKEHIRLNSSMVILSRSFKNFIINDLSKFEKEFKLLQNAFNTYSTTLTKEMLLTNKLLLKNKVSDILYLKEK